MTRAVLVKTPGQMGEILRARRRAERLSQAAVAARLALTQASLSKLESQPDALPLERLLRLCDLLGLELLVQKRDASATKTTEW